MLTFTLTGCVVSGNCIIRVDVVISGGRVDIIISIGVEVVVNGESVVDVTSTVVVAVTGAGSVIKAPTALQSPKLLSERAFTFQ